MSLPLWECGLKYNFRGWRQGAGKSLPLWECGLKSPFQKALYPSISSLPLWECGLKLFLPAVNPYRTRSLPLWECGLKLRWRTAYSIRHGVTPFMGVWIEIIIDRFLNAGEECHSLYGSVD